MTLFLRDLTSFRGFGLLYIVFQYLEHTKKAIQSPPSPTPPLSYLHALQPLHDPPTGTLWFSQEAAYFLCVYLVTSGCQSLPPLFSAKVHLFLVDGSQL